MNLDRIVRELNKIIQEHNLEDTLYVYPVEEESTVVVMKVENEKVKRNRSVSREYSIFTVRRSGGSTYHVSGLDEEVINGYISMGSARSIREVASMFEEYLRDQNYI